MTTPVSSQFTSVRYFTGLDPYSFGVDNRPLQDLNTNISRTAAAVDSVNRAQKIVTMAVGMVARGYAAENMYVGEREVLSGTFQLRLNHGFLLQNLQVSLSDLRQYPHVGLQQTAITFPAFTKPNVAGYKRCFTLEARFKVADNTISFYNNADVNEPNTVEVGVVEYAIQQAGIDVLETDPDNYPAATPGWISILHIKTHEDDAELDPTKVTRDRFMEDGAFYNAISPYEVWSTSISAAQTTISAIEVDAYKAMFFAAGVYQPPSTYTVTNESEIELNIPFDDTVQGHFIIFRGAGNTNVPGGNAPSIYSYDIDTHVAGPGGQQLFTGISVDANFAFVFVNGTFQAGVTVVNNSEINLPAPVPEGTVVDFVTTSGGIGVPPGGLVGQSLHKTTAATDWQYEILPTDVVSASVTGPTEITYSASVSGFDETTDLYDGRMLILSGAGFSTIPTNDLRNVVVVLGSLTLPLKRQGNSNLLLNDVYNGCLVQYRVVGGPARLEIVVPGGLQYYGGHGTIGGDANALVFTPAHPIAGLEDGSVFSIKVPNTIPSNTTTTPTFRVNTYGSPGYLEFPVLRSVNAEPVKLGDIVAGGQAVLQFEETAGMFVLRNPVNSSSTIVSPGKRQTVFQGPISNTVGTFSAVNAGAGTVTSQNLSYGYRGTLLAAINSPRSIQILAGGKASFAAGFSQNGALDYVADLPPFGAVVDIAGIGFQGILGGSITSIVYDSNSITVNLSSPHSIPSLNNTWMRITGLTASNGSRLNGSYRVSGSTANSITFERSGSTSATLSTGLASVRIDPIVFIYADRDTTTGAISYGYTRLRPFYLDSRVIGQSTFDTYANSAGRHTFDIAQMKMYLGNGASKTEVQRVFLGEGYIPNTATSVAATHATTYAYGGVSIQVAAASVMLKDNTYPGATVTADHNVFSHNLGVNAYSLNLKMARIANTNEVKQLEDITSGAAVLYGEGGRLVREDTTSDFFQLIPFYRDHTSVKVWIRDDNSGFVSEDGAGITQDFTSSRVRLVIRAERSF